MPKVPNASTTSIEGGMLSLAQATKTTVGKSSRTVSSSIRRSANTRNGNKKKQGLLKLMLQCARALPSVKKSSEAIQAILDTLEEKTMHESWRYALKAEFSKPYFIKVPSELQE